MNRLEKIRWIRNKIDSGDVSLGSWIQLPDSSSAEIMGQAGYDWVAVDMEHGSIGHHQLPDIFRALELGNTLPLARLAQGNPKDCKQALDAGAGGVIVPMVNSAEQLRAVQQACCWPPAGRRGVGYSRANLFGKNFARYNDEAQAPILVAMIEHIDAVEDLDGILSVPGLDAILVGPYDLSASLSVTSKFDDPEFIKTIDRILEKCKTHGIACGMHVVAPDVSALQKKVSEGYSFIAYSLDSVFLTNSSQCPEINTQ